jgi:hypothetical protein
MMAGSRYEKKSIEGQYQVSNNVSGVIFSAPKKSNFARFVLNSSLVTPEGKFLTEGILKQIAGRKDLETYLNMNLFSYFDIEEFRGNKTLIANFLQPIFDGVRLTEDNELDISGVPDEHKEKFADVQFVKRFQSVANPGYDMHMGIAHLPDNVARFQQSEAVRAVMPEAFRQEALSFMQRKLLGRIYHNFQAEYGSLMDSDIRVVQVSQAFDRMLRDIEVIPRSDAIAYFKDRLAEEGKHSPYQEAFLGAIDSPAICTGGEADLPAEQRFIG